VPTLWDADGVAPWHLAVPKMSIQVGLLRGGAAVLRYAATIRTGVPTLTWLNSASASGTCMRMQPCEAE
jgi:hypothetical protein